MVASHCRLCGKPVDETCERLPAGGGWACRECLEGKSNHAQAIGRILAALNELEYGEIRLTIHQSRVKHIQTTKTEALGG